MTSPSDPARLLAQLFEAERAVRHAHAALGATSAAARLAALKAAAAEALAEAREAEKALRLVRIAALLGELEGPEAVDLLIDILGCDEPEARHAAGEALEDLAYDRFKEVALGIERALERLPVEHLALAELPYLLADIPEPGVLRLLSRFLAHKDPEAVAGAIEALVEFGDPSATAMLAALEKDMRQVVLEDDEGEEGKVTLGELAREARELLSDDESGGSSGDEPSSPAGGTAARGKGRGGAARR